MKKLLMKMKDNYKLLFCYGLIGLGILLVIVVLIKQPMKKVTSALYNTEEEVVIEEVSFPIKQTIGVDVNYLTGLWLYLDDYSINEYDHDIEVVGDDGKTYFSAEYKNYESNIIYMDFGVIEDSDDMELELVINCDKCENVKLASVKKEDETMMLKLAKENYVKNNIYYWHSIMAIAIGLVLLPLAKEEK